VGLGAALVFLARALAVLPALLLAGCTGLIFQPLPDHLLTPDRIGLPWRDVAFTTADGVRLHGWFLPASAPRQGSVLLLHGNAENISTHIASVAWLPGAGFDVLLFDYRGYGRSVGSPTLDGLHDDFAAALATLFALPEVDPRRVVVLGQSLGGALAITGLASSPRRRAVRALVVEGAFTSYRALAQEKLADFWPTWPHLQENLLIPGGAARHLRAAARAAAGGVGQPLGDRPAEAFDQLGDVRAGFRPPAEQLAGGTVGVDQPA
jgi:pimeloyl-ACP methyl ester carboxylesterase